MSQPDIILIIALAVIAGGIGYLLGTRSPKRGGTGLTSTAPPPVDQAGTEKLKDPIVTPVVAQAVVSRPPAQPTAREEPSHNDLIEAAATPRPPDANEEKKQEKTEAKTEEKKEPKLPVSPELTQSQVFAKEERKGEKNEEKKEKKESKDEVKATLPSATPAKSEPKAGTAALVAAIKASVAPKVEPSPKPPPQKSEPVPANAAKPQVLTAALAAMITPPAKGKSPQPPPAKPAAAPPKVEPSAKSSAKQAAAKALSDSKRDIPKIDFEEDDDVEPTKVGEMSTQILQPPLMKIVFDDEADSDEPMSEVPLFVISATAQTDPGLRRKRNEDNLLVLESANLFVVADGMGGHRGGQFASELAVKRIGDAYRSQKFEGDPHDGIGKDASELARAMQMANAAIFAEAKRQRELEGMGTTLCGARFSPNKRRMVIGHVGDSRCYRLREGVLSTMTHDHTMADHGITGPESANLSRAIGIWPTVPMDVILAVPKVGDVYLLCSDGLTKMLPDEQIATVLRAEDDPKAAVERLIFFANARGGKDNVTVILLRVVQHKPG